MTCINAFFFFPAVSLLIFCTGLHNSTNVSIRLHYQLPMELEQCERSYGSQCNNSSFLDLVWEAAGFVTGTGKQEMS